VSTNQKSGDWQRVAGDAVFCGGMVSLMYGGSMLHASIPWVVFGVVVVSLSVYSRAKGS